MRKSKLLRCALAATLACGLMIPTTATTAFAAEENSATPPLASEISSEGEENFDETVGEVNIPAETDSADDAAGATASANPSTEGGDDAHVQSAVQAASLGVQYLGRMNTAAVASSSDDAVQPLDESWVVAGPFEIRGGSAGSDANSGDYYLDAANKILHIRTSAPMAIRNKDVAAATDVTIQIDAGVKADLTLAGVNISSGVIAPINVITNSDEDKDGVRVKNAADIKNKTTLHLTLADGSTNTLFNSKTDKDGRPGLRCGWGSILIIDDEITNIRAGGSKFVEGDIVTPENGAVAADVTLLDGTQLKKGDALGKLDSANPGKLISTGGAHSPGIGGAPKENAGTIIINGGDINAAAYLSGHGGYSSAAGIGGGSCGSGTVITINGGTITASAGMCGSGIGAGIGYRTDASHVTDCTESPDAIVVPRGEENSFGYSYYGTAVSGSYTPDASGVYGRDVCHVVAGDITMNGGFVRAKGTGHGNAFGQPCAHGAGSNRNHVIRITGGTLLTSVERLSSPPNLYSIGALFGYTIVTGGSVYIENTAMFQGIGDTAYNTQGIATWSDVIRVAGGDPNDSDASKRKYLPDTDKVFMITVNLADSDEKMTDEKLDSFKLFIGNEEYSYGAPSRFDDGKLYLWLPEWVAEKDNEKEVRIEMSVLRDGSTTPEVIDPLFISKPSTTNPDQTVKRYIEFPFPADYEKNTLTKDYDGEPFPAFKLTEPIVVNRVVGDETRTETLTDPDEVKFKFQLLKQNEAGEWVPDGLESAEGAASLPVDAGRFTVTMTSYEYANREGYANSYWGHQAKGTAVIRPVPAILHLDSAQWGYLDEDDGSWKEILPDQPEGGVAGNRLKLSFYVRPADGTASTCAAPTGSFQVMIDGKAVGDPIELSEEAMKASPHSTLTEKDIAGHHAVEVVYYLDPTHRDGLLQLLEQAGDGEQHTVNIEYLPAKNYIEGVEDNPQNADEGDTFIVPVKPEGDVQPDPEDKDKVTIETSPAPEPGPGGTDPDNPTGKMQVVRKTITASYGDFHSADAADFFRLAVTSTSSAAGAWSVSNAAVADLVMGENGSPALDENGKLQIKVNSCGTSVITLEQKANALYTGIKYILTVNILPDPLVKPQVQIRLTQRNLTALAEGAGNPAAAFVARAFPEASAEAGIVPQADASGRADAPPRPGDVIEYTVTGLNLTPGSAWQGAELVDAIDARLAFDADSVEIARNYATHSDKYDLGTPAFYSGFDWDGLDWTDVKQGDYAFSASTLTKGIGTVYGGQSTSVRFRATVGEDQGLGDRPGEDGKLPEIGNEPAGSGGYGKDEADLAPGEEAVPPEKLVPDVDIVVVGEGDKDPETGKFPDPEPTPVLPKDPTAADIVTTVKVEQKEKGEDHGDDRFLVGDTLTVTVTSENIAPDSKLADAVVKATLPEGMEPKPGTIKLKDAQGNVHDVPDSAYDPKTGVIAVNAGDLYGGEKVELVFDVEVTSTPETREPGDESGTRPTDPVVEGGTLGTTPTDEWEREHPTDPGATPDEPYVKPEPGTPFEPTKPWEEIEDELVSTPPAVDPEMPPVLPASPSTEGKDGAEADIKVAKTAENLTRDDGTTAVGDTVRYTVTLSNSGPHTMWYGAVVRDVLPLGIDPLAGTIRLTAPDGSVTDVPDSAYDPATRVLAVTAGDLAGGRTAVLTFECEVTAEAVGADIGNVASAHGTTPAGVDLGTVGDGAERPAPGQPFDPSEGWDAFLEEHPGVDNAGEPAYAPGTDASGGVLAEAPGSGDGSGNGDEANGSSGKKQIRLAQTGDDAALWFLLLPVIAMGAAVTLAAACRRRG
ncbi:hypothetical protein [uncultured Adlercreutzia sp.]|uniref:hypothetical protein n=1 Tax=uncultured Adlercreutzia sp. TaxID=875803 RepID=UPI00267652A3|nr:hypothetical protein [uncultured Adlercreutzia sp.]